MAFKTVNSYNEQRFGDMFILRNDGDYADVVFLYKSTNDVLVADTHYIKSADYSGYVHCCERGCPACANNIRVQTKLFIPLYNFNSGKVEFWDRTMRFEPQLMKDVFENYPDPSQYVFRITRHGVPNDVNTTYEIRAVAKNSAKPFEVITAENHITFPEYYNTVCKEVRSDELYGMLNSKPTDSSVYSGDMPNYQVTPRAVSGAPVVPPPAAVVAAQADVVCAGPSIDVGGDGMSGPVEVPAVASGNVVESGDSVNVAEDVEDDVNF